MIGGGTQVFALVGRPVEHSLSPALYNPLFEQLGIDAVYVAFDVAPERGGELAGAIRTLGLAGVNLTVPHKAAILDDLDATSDQVDLARAANVVVRDGERLVGHNTDGEGFCRAWEARFDTPLAGVRVVILGAGGAARAVAASLAGRGAAALTMLNRTVSRAEAFLSRLGAGHDGIDLRAGALDRGAFARHAASADLVVNATSGGAAPTIAGWSIDALPAHATWADLNYWMDDPPLLEACRERGLRTWQGLDMLIGQAALAFELFTGRVVDPARMRGGLDDAS